MDSSGINDTPRNETQSCVCSSSAGDGPATGGGGVFRSDDAVPVSSGGSGSVARSQRCDTLSARTYSAAAHDASRCHGDERQQQQPLQSASTGVCWRCFTCLGRICFVVSLPTQASVAEDVA